MLSNRISFALDLQGPSLTVDSACSSAGYALELAYEAFKSNKIDGAIVGGCNLLLHPYAALNFARSACKIKM
jgi:acyl transferase domain-containing protein